MYEYIAAVLLIISTPIKRQVSQDTYYNYFRAVVLMNDGAETNPSAVEGSDAQN